MCVSSCSDLSVAFRCILVYPSSHDICTYTALHRHLFLSIQNFFYLFCCPLQEPNDCALFLLFSYIIYESLGLLFFMGIFFLIMGLRVFFFLDKMRRGTEGVFTGALLFCFLLLIFNYLYMLIIESLFFYVFIFERFSKGIRVIICGSSHFFFDFFIKVYVNIRERKKYRGYECV